MSDIKVVAVGDGAVGKTCLLTSFTPVPFPQEYYPKLQDHTLQIVVGADTVNLNLFDTPGQEDYSQIRRLYYAQTNVFLICFSMVNEASFTNTSKKWLKELKSYSTPDTRYILVGTKIDLLNDPTTLNELQQAGERPTTVSEALDLAKKLRIPFISCSALNSANINNLLDLIVQTAVASKKEHKKLVKTYTCKKEIL
eukprot:TRINITY_DN11033_c0_g1_i1.p1 TRINITY_DN11033_c0_g1~~TRINITY_DN11033_c0_g1_i1.p1  ORF type:complete len:197 (-),score=26.19 TRINITY_DN11033_c0_g1_i1:37-627(-)